jgi:hypothetical protein
MDTNRFAASISRLSAAINDATACAIEAGWTGNPWDIARKIIASMEDADRKSGPWPEHLTSTQVNVRKPIVQDSER